MTSSEMKPLQHILAEQMLNKNVHFKCDCSFPIDITGRIVDYEIISNEIIFKVQYDSKIISIGLNHPRMTAQIL